ncbi:TMV resistance protein N-like [Pistacia vera]|uniref:TMV resistance protein N-like n=1 Tax=Pistacia vera TaxID=55513 RepID=UPI001263DC35|nr:TMV resistance protein N-like [Pistacia vera]
MASSSLTTRENDVYLCFRGEDVRNNFINHLDKALRRKKIQTFINNQLDPGECIPRSIVHAMEESKISVIVFSEKYAASLWFLEELEKILACKNRYGQIVMTVYYHVDPSDVRNQTGNFGKRFAMIEEQLKESPQTLVRYKSALEEAVNIYGFDWQVIR